jgi:MORN repeat
MIACQLFLIFLFVFLFLGEWEDGLMHGSGRMAWADGKVFVGAYVKGKMHGKGEMSST